MAGALVGGAFLSGFINVMFDRLLSPDATNLVVDKKLDKELVERLKNALCAAEALLVDAEHKQFDNQFVKNWLDSLRDGVYKADDLLDFVFTKAATQREVRTFFSRFLNFEDRVMVNKIDGVVRRIKDLEKQKYILGLKEIPRGNLSWRTPSTSLVKGNVYGREDDQKAIIKMINENNENQLSVIPIVGMGGVGKTTLAQWVYSNEELMKGFDLKAWVCVSEEFDIAEITKSIIGGITSSTCSLNDLNLLQLDLKQKLSENKFFIVLDDVWSDDGDMWNNFKTPFQHGIKGSTILITTRSKEVASVVQTCSLYFLNELSEDYCWLVFTENACFPYSNGDSTLEEIGRKIVKKCKGLPLAAETLGRLLRIKHDAKEWNTILTCDIWEFSIKNSKIIPALLISYYHLPAYLKRCFIYCSLYPKDYKFVKDELILLWMAEDLLRQPKIGETLEEVGYECFDDLASRIFFKQLRNDDEFFVMHDLLHDLAIFLAGDFYCRLEELGKVKKMSIKTRHLSYGSLSHPISENFDFVDKVESLRTLLQINFSPPSFNSERTTCTILSKLKYLRVLSFHSFSQLDELPDSICELIHLRYLDLTWTNLRTLPKSLCDLYNLQTLKLFRCYKLNMLPCGMHNLVNLRHLDIRKTSLEEMPGGMSKLKNLQLLSYFVAGRQEESGIKELGALSNLHGALEIRKLENVANSNEAMEAKMMNKMHIDNLYLQWSSDADMVSNTQMETDILDKLQPHNGLKELTVKGYRGTTFPNWVGHSSYYNMTRVTLRSCNNCCMLPSLAQLPSLKSLCIEDFDGLESIGITPYAAFPVQHSATPFPSLVNLTFHRMRSWEVWHSFDPDAFPQLEYLSLSNCPRLMGDLPNHLPALKTLKIDRCQQLVSSLSRAPKVRELVISKSDNMMLQELPLSLEILSIGGSQLVESMFRAMSINNLTCLKVMEISDCSSAISLPDNCLPESLETLRIRNCRKLEFPKQRQQRCNLLKLEIENSCDSSITSFSLESFPNLKLLKIKRCKNLESLSMPQPEHAAALHRLVIDRCPNFVSFPKEGLVAPNLTIFEVCNCNKLKSLPCRMNTLLPNLERFEVMGCPEIDSFPEAGLPHNLKSLWVEGCEKLLSGGLSSMGKLEALNYLYINGDGCESVKSFPKVGLLPPLPSLTTLYLCVFSSLETLQCNELLPFTSLQQLDIQECPKLENLTGERLPPSLLKLEIAQCSSLGERCKMKDPQIWPKILHIRGIEVDGRWVS